MPRQVIVRAPSRIDLGGGWTDVPPYCDREGGFVCNVAIARYATATISGAAAHEPAHAEPELLHAVNRRFDLGGARLSLVSDFPVSAGLGGSSAASAAMLVAASEWRREPWDRAGIAELGRRVEVEDLGIAGGRQDHYAAAFGGALGLRFTDAVAISRLRVDPRTLDDFVARSVLVYTGESRVSGDTITAVLGAYERGERRVIEALQRMKDLARDMANALEHGDLDALGALVGEHWTFQRALHPAIPTALIDDIIERARNAGALGAKAMGASGGGCVLLFARRADVPAVRNAVTGMGTFLDFRVDTEGVSVVSAE